MPQPNLSIKTKRDNFRRLLSNGLWAGRLLFKTAPIETIFLVTLPVISAVIPTASAYVGARFIDQLITISKGGLSSVGQLTIFSPISLTILLVAALQLIQSLLGSVNRYLDRKFQNYHLRKLDLVLYQKISNFDVLQFEDPAIGNTIRKATENTYKVRVFVNTSITLISQLVTLTIAAVISFRVSWPISLLILLSAIPANLVYGRFIKQIWNYFNTTTEDYRKGWWMVRNNSNQQFAPEHKITSGHTFLQKQIDTIFNSLYGREFDIYKKRFKSGNLLTLLDVFNSIITVLFLLDQTLKGKITIGQFTFYRGRFQDFNNQSSDLISTIIEIVDAGSYLEHVRAIWEMQPAITNGKRKIDLKTPPLIEFQNVSFKYPKSKRFVLKNISLVIKPGDKIAIVGENGAGKSTLIKLLMRFYDPTEGQILVNKILLPEYDLASYYRVFATLFQEYNQYRALDITDNIVVGDLHKRPNSESIKKAAESAEAASFIDQLENKYAQRLTPDFTGGVNLSTGQWQKLALARLFYRGMQVLILDEPTASIDAEAEFRIFQRIFANSKGKSMIIISHRFSTVRNAQTIYVLKAGKIIESGTHEKLLKLSGHYAKAFHLQAKGYQP